MAEFCRCGKPVQKGGRCQACYMVDYRASKKENSDIKHLELNTIPFLDQLKSTIIPIFKTKTDELITDWTQKHISLPDGEGAFSASTPDWSITPEMSFIFEQLKNPDVKEIYLMFSSQSSKTLFQICAQAWFINARKVNGLFVPPSEKLIKRIKRRMENIYNASNLGFEKKKGGDLTLTFGSNYINIGLASAPDSLAEMPADFVIFDELDEIKPQELNPVTLARSRGRTRPNFKLILGSTPKKLEGNGGIMDYYKNSKRFCLEMQCPHCGEWSEFDESTISAQEGADHRSIESDSLGFAMCPKHGCVIDDESHEQMVMSQRWKDLDPDLPMTYIGFHKASWNTVFNDFSSIAAKRIRTKEEGINSEKDFYNSECAKPVDLDSLGGDTQSTELALDKYLRKEIPEDVVAMTMGIDLGVYECYVVVIGWGPEGKIYEIFEQTFAWDNRDFEKLERGINHVIREVRSDFFYHGDPINRPNLVGGCFDSGYRPNLVYNFCRKNPIFIPIKGRHPLSKPWVITPADPQRKHGEKAKGVKLYTLNSYYWQDVLQTAIERPGDFPGSFNIPKDFHPTYLEHLNGEVKKLKLNSAGLQVEIWEKKTSHSKNDYRDATIYAMVRGHTLDIHNLSRAGEIIEAPERKTLKKYNPKNNQRGRINTRR